MARLAEARFLVVGVGGVGGWCAEALARTGACDITLVDDDAVSPSNLNRQCAATVATLGRAKVEAMAERLRAVNPDCRVGAVCARYPDPAVDVRGFGVVVDAIDSVESKAALISACIGSRVPVVSSMGAALRTDPTRVKVTEFSRVCGDGLARALRRRLRGMGVEDFGFTAVWSEEAPADIRLRGSVMTVTGAFGLALAAEAMRQVFPAD